MNQLVSFKPHRYQEEAIHWILEHEKCGLFLPMGAGKTVSTLTALTKLIGIDVSKVLIIGPVRVVQSTWPDEIQKWPHTKEMTFQILDGKVAKGKVELDTAPDISLIGKENVADLIQTYSRDWPFDMVIIDELSTFKNPKSKRFKALKKIMPLADRFVGLTGTPAPNGIPDLWSQIYLMDGGKRLGRTLSSFRDQFLIPGRRQGHIVYEWLVQEGAEERIYGLLGDICMSIKQGDCAKLPPLQVIDYPVNLGNMLNKYKAFKRERVMSLGQEDGDESYLLASNAGVLCGKLLQFTSGEVYIESFSEQGLDEDLESLTPIPRESKKIHDAKLNALDDLVEAANGQPMIVFYYFQHEYVRILEHFTKQKKSICALDGPDTVHDWNEGKIDILLLHPASAGHGLNLQKGGNIAIWYTLPNWNLELYQQANARIYRQGQEKAVTIYHLVARDTVDEDMLVALKEKDVTQRRVIEALRKDIL